MSFRFSTVIEPEKNPKVLNKRNAPISWQITRLSNCPGCSQIKITEN